MTQRQSKNSQTADDNGYLAYSRNHSSAEFDSLTSQLPRKIWFLPGAWNTVELLAREGKRSGDEIGGHLVGVFLSSYNAVCVTNILVGRNQIRTPGSLDSRPDETEVGREFSILDNLSNGMLYILGRIHTHPGTFDKPSGIDISSYTDYLIEERVDSMICPIITNDPRFTVNGYIYSVSNGLHRCEIGVMQCGTLQSAYETIPEFSRLAATLWFVSEINPKSLIAPGSGKIMPRSPAHVKSGQTDIYTSADVYDKPAVSKPDLFEPLSEHEEEKWKQERIAAGKRKIIADSYTPREPNRSMINVLAIIAFTVVLSLTVWNTVCVSDLREAFSTKGSEFENRLQILESAVKVDNPDADSTPYDITSPSESVERLATQDQEKRDRWDKIKARAGNAEFESADKKFVNGEISQEEYNAAFNKMQP